MRKLINIVEESRQPKPARLWRLTNEMIEEDFVAYHGSAHDFDKFDINKIGAGEGTQTFGAGLYFTDTKQVAKTYIGTAIGDRGKQDFMLNWERYVISPQTGEYEVRRRDPDGSAGDWHPISKEDFDKAFEIAQAKIRENSGIYKVRIHADKNDFLDWDAPLSKQSAHVKQALAKLDLGELSQSAASIYKDLKRRGWDDHEAMEYAKNNAYEADGAHVVGKLGRDRWSAKKLLKAGIVGIKYLDAFSRHRGVGTYNYVVLDDNLVEIIGK